MTSNKAKTPHYIPGYTGYSPQFIYRMSDTYGALTHKTLVDFSKSHAENITLSTRADDEYRIERPILKPIDIVKARENISEPTYNYPSPGYEGYIPFIGENRGNRYAILVDENIPEMDKQMLEEKCKAKTLNDTMVQQDKNFHYSLGERSLVKEEYKYPLSRLRPDIENIESKYDIKDLPEPPPLPFSEEYGLNVNSLKNENTFEESIESTPLPWPEYGKGNKAFQNSILCDFVNNYHHRRSEEWPVTNNIIMGNMKSNHDNFGIYSKHRGIIPNYTGHVPGQKFAVGTTFWKSTIDPKRFLNE